MRDPGSTSASTASSADPLFFVLTLKICPFFALPLKYFALPSLENGPFRLISRSRFR